MPCTIQENDTLKILLLAAALACGTANADPAAGPAGREYIYGAELMTPQERDAYRAGIERAGDDAARGQYRQRHRERLQQRAGERGVELDGKGIVRRRGETK